MRFRSHAFFLMRLLIYWHVRSSYGEFSGSFPWFSRVFRCFPRFSSVFSGSFPWFSHVMVCFPVVFRGFLMFSGVFRGLVL